MPRRHLPRRWRRGSKPCPDCQSPTCGRPGLRSGGHSAGRCRRHDACGALCVAFLRRAADAGVPLVGVWTGAFILHRAGLMRGYRCCVSWFHHEEFLEQFEGIRPVSDRIFVVDRDRLTCSGGARSAHLTAWFVDRHVGRGAATKSLHIMIIDNARKGEVPQPGPADRTGHTGRAGEEGAQPDAAIDGRAAERGAAGGAAGGRPAKARAALPRGAGAGARGGRQVDPHRPGAVPAESGARSITQIANDTGFCDVSHLIRVVREREGVTPRGLPAAVPTGRRRVKLSGSMPVAYPTRAGPAPTRSGG